MTGREIRSALHDGRRVYSTCAVAQAPNWPRMLATAGIDFVFIDTEHIPHDRRTLSWMCHAYTGQGIPPVVRIPSPDPYEAVKVLDGGAAGVIGPYVETVDQARALVGAARYRPLKGKRLEAALDDPASLEPELREYLEHRNADTILIVNIESVPAMENLDQILQVSGLDSVLIGPHDLSCSLGVPEQYRHQRFDAAVRTIIETARRHGLGAGIHFWEGIDQEIDWCRAGANLIMHSADAHLVAQNLAEDLNQIRRQLGDQAVDERHGPMEV